jgi:para-aminobenzoate synthetase / 4-amino-4-deoxychorismate lyase
VIADDLDRLFRHPARPRVVELGAGPEPPALIRRLPAGAPHAALWGAWFGGGAILLRDPITWQPLEHAADAFDLLDRQPEARRSSEDALGGGWLACLGYAPGHSWVGYFDHVLRWRPATGWRFETLGLSGRQSETDEALARARSELDEARSEQVVRPPSCTGSAMPDFDASPGAQQGHLAAVEWGIARIGRGDFYQVNLCTRLRASFSGRSAELFADAADRLRPAYGAMIDTGSGESLLSFSPELFLQRHDDHVRTAPIKGTSPIDADPNGRGLAHSAKDVAENIMITDLMRNDLSRVCRPGTVRVERLLEVQQHPGVWHLVSTVGGDQHPGTSVGDLLRATFPPGSVTGAPKLAAMDGIAALEPQSRGAYTGALGFCSPAGRTELSVIIRTFEVTGDRVELGAGGGITADSVPIREWYECLHKAQPLVTAAGARLSPGLVPAPPPIPEELRAAGLIETLLSRDGVVLRLAAHLARLERSCSELYGIVPGEDLGRRLQLLAASSGGQRLGLRTRVIPVEDRLEIGVDSWVAPEPPRRVRLVLSERPDWSWRHKWADRTRLQAAEAAVRFETVDESLALPYFTTAAGSVAETSRGNLCWLGPDGVWRTPPEDDHTLPGITRRELLGAWTDRGQLAEIRRADPDELRAAAAILTTSSISGLVIVEEIDGHRLPVSPKLSLEVADLNRRLDFG